MRIDGHFTDRNEDRIDVAIYNMYVTANNINIDNSSNIRFADDPVIIETDCEDSFTHIIKTKCKISLTTKIWLGDYLFANNAESIVVNVFRTHNNVKTCIFCGFVTPNSFSQDYAHEWETIEINCIDYLTVLEYKYPTDDATYEDLKANVTSRPFIYFLDKMRLNNTQMIIPNLPDTLNESIWVETDYQVNPDESFNAIESELAIIDASSAVNTGNTRIGRDLTPTWIQSEDTFIDTDGLIYYKDYAWVDVNGVATKTDVWRKGEAAEMPYVVDTVNTMIGYVRENRFEYYDYYRVDWVMNTGDIIEGMNDAVGDLIPEYPSTTSLGSYYELRQGDVWDLYEDPNTGNLYYKNYAWVVQIIDNETVETKTNDWEIGNVFHQTISGHKVSTQITNLPTLNISTANNSYSIAASTTNLDTPYQYDISYQNITSLGFISYKDNIDTMTFDLSSTYITSTNGLFINFRYLTELDLSSFDTSHVTDMRQMFGNCRSLTSLNLSNFDTGNVTDMYQMFGWCRKLTTIDVSNWDTSKVTNMGAMFQDCQKLTYLDVSNWDTGNVTNMYRMFDLCWYLGDLDVSNWDTGNVTNMSYMFNKCTEITYLDVSDWNTSNVTDMSNMFNECWNLGDMDMTNWDTSNVTNMSYMFYTAHSIRSLELSDWDTSNVTDMHYMFGTAWNFEYIGVSNWDTSNVINMNALFYGCDSLTYLDVSNWDTSSATDMSLMFHSCIHLTSLDLSSFNTSYVTDMSGMFSLSRKIRSLDLSNFDTSNVTKMINMFDGCYDLGTVDLSNWDTSNVTDMSGMFNACTSLGTLTLDNTSNNTFNQLLSDADIPTTATLYRDGDTYLYNTNTNQWEKQ